MTEHTFDRIPNKPDERDLLMSNFLDTNRTLTETNPLANVDAALAAFVSKSRSKTGVVLAKAIVAYLHSNAPPSPPPPIAQAIYWEDPWQLDQGSTGHCVGFGWAQRFNSLEANDPDEKEFSGYTNADGDRIYYECKVIDGEPGQENGSQVRSGAKAMQARGKLANYVFANTVDEIIAWVLTKGPVVIGSNWMSEMDSPNSNGVVTVGGTVRGGHCYLCDGYDPTTKMFRFQNSWGTSFGKNGYFYMTSANFKKLFASQGDACGAVELE